MRPCSHRFTTDATCCKTYTAEPGSTKWRCRTSRSPWFRRVDGISVPVLSMEVVLERIRAKWLRAVPGDHDRLLEFDALASADRADVALYADHHVLLEYAIVAGRLHVFLVEDHRVFDRHTGAVDDLGEEMHFFGVAGVPPGVEIGRAHV